MDILNERANEDPHGSKTFGVQSTKKAIIEKNKKRVKSVENKWFL